MRLTAHTDIGLRLLSICSIKSPEAISARTASRLLKVSYDHLMKVAQKLSSAGLITSERGRLGGFAITQHGMKATVGQVVRLLEPDLDLVACQQKSSIECPLVIGCRLPKLLQSATENFLETLDEVRICELTHQNEKLEMALGGR